MQVFKLTPSRQYRNCWSTVSEEEILNKLEHSESTASELREKNEEKFRTEEPYLLSVGYSPRKAFGICK
jgi:hypothetical protein